MKAQKRASELEAESIVGCGRIYSRQLLGFKAVRSLDF